MQRPFQRLLTRAQFQAVLAGQTVAKSPHFSLHRQSLAMSTASPNGAQSTAIGERSASVGEPEVETPLRTRALFPRPGPWLGAMVPKRWAKRAVTRNTIKRQIYAVSSEFSPRDVQAAFLVRLRRDFSKQEFRSASSDLLKQAIRSELQTLYELAGRRA